MDLTMNEFDPDTRELTDIWAGMFAVAEQAIERRREFLEWRRSKCRGDFRWFFDNGDHWRTAAKAEGWSSVDSIAEIAERVGLEGGDYDLLTWCRACLAPTIGAALVSHVLPFLEFPARACRICVKRHQVLVSSVKWRQAAEALEGPSWHPGDQIIEEAADLYVQTGINNLIYCDCCRAPMMGVALIRRMNADTPTHVAPWSKADGNFGKYSNNTVLCADCGCDCRRCREWARAQQQQTESGQTGGRSGE